MKILYVGLVLTFIVLLDLAASAKLPYKGWSRGDSAKNSENAVVDANKEFIQGDMAESRRTCVGAGGSCVPGVCHPGDEYIQDCYFKGSCCRRERKPSYYRFPSRYRY